LSLGVTFSSIFPKSKNSGFVCLTKLLTREGLGMSNSYDTTRTTLQRGADHLPLPAQPQPQGEQACPQCQTLLPVYTNYVTWCHGCGWNLKPYAESEPENILDKMYLELGRKSSQALFEDVRKRGWQVKRHTIPSLSLMLAYLLAVLVYLLTFAVGVAGGVLLVRDWPGLLSTLIGIIAVLVTVGMLGTRYRFKLKDGKAEGEISPAQFPTLYQTVNKVATFLGTSNVDKIILDARFNASITQFGWRRKKVLRLGLPLFCILTTEEKIALLGHELGHCVNGDPNRSLVVGTALRYLVEWYKALYPESIWPKTVRQGSVDGSSILILLSSVVTNIISLWLANLVKFWIFILSHLLWRDKQRAEYYADSLAAKVAGTEAMLGMLQKLHYTSTFELALQQFAMRPQNANFFKELMQEVTQVPPREIERVSGVERLEQSRLDTTHPPTANRIEFLQHPKQTHAWVRLEGVEENSLGAELAQAQSRIQTQMVDKHLDSLYSTPRKLKW
jgi:heat shock protein HtpX